MGHLRGTGDSLGLEQRKRLDGGLLYNARIQKGNTLGKSTRKKENDGIEQCLPLWVIATPSHKAESLTSELAR